MASCAFTTCTHLRRAAGTSTRSVSTGVPYAAYLAGFPINAPGFIYSCNPNIKVPLPAQHIYTLSWLTGTGVSALVYYISCVVSPPPGMNTSFEEIDESEFRLELFDVPPTTDNKDGADVQVQAV